MAELLKLGALLFLPITIALSLGFNALGTSLWGGKPKTYTGPRLTVTIEPPPGAAPGADGGVRIGRWEPGAFAVKIDGRSLAEAPELIQLALVKFSTGSQTLAEGVGPNRWRVPAQRLGLGFHDLVVELTSATENYGQARLRVEVVRHALSGASAPAPRIASHTPPRAREGATLIFDVDTPIQVLGAVDGGARLSWWERSPRPGALPRKLGDGPTITLSESNRLGRELILRSELPGHVDAETRLVYERRAGGAPTTPASATGSSAGLVGGLGPP